MQLHDSPLAEHIKPLGTQQWCQQGFCIVYQKVKETTMASPVRLDSRSVASSEAAGVSQCGLKAKKYM